MADEASSAAAAVAAVDVTATPVVVTGGNGTLAASDRSAEQVMIDVDASADEAKTVPAAKAPMVTLTPEIRWHCGPTGLNEAVLSIDFLHPNAKQTGDGSATIDQHQPTVLATGGADKEIKLWRVGDDLKDHNGLEFVFSLSGHDRSVNCVRFSPNGEFLASASDDSTIILWTKPKTAAEDWAWDKITSFSDVARTLLACGHKGDITDLAWSPDSAFLCSTSVDNTSVIWNVEKGEVEERRKDHTQYVQGVAWDPLNEYLVTEGNDRSCRVYSLNGFDPVSRLSSKKSNKKCVCVQTIKTREFPAPKTESVKADPKPEEPTGQPAAATNTESAPQSTAAAEDSAARAVAASKHRMFLDDTCPAFARRPTWTPDGNYFLAPTGIFRSSEAEPPVNTVYAFARGNLSEPTLHLPGQEKASLGVRCSPLLYELRRLAEDAETAAISNFFQTPHRSIFAVITLNTVVIYDTQQAHPICTLKDLHYADLTDVSWSRDGQLLSISSMDGYLSFVKFQDGFFGTSVIPAAHVALNQEKIQTMFATRKPARAAKKHKAQPASAGDDANGGASAKKKQKVATPAVRKKSDTKAAAVDGSVVQPAAQQASVPVASSSGVNTLQVRKKRKISPVLVQATPVAAAVSSSGDAPSTVADAITPSQAKEDTGASTEVQEGGVNGSAKEPITL